MDFKSLPRGLWLFSAQGYIPLPPPRPPPPPPNSSRNNPKVIPAYLCSFLQVHLEEYEMAASAYFSSQQRFQKVSGIYLPL